MTKPKFMGWERYLACIREHLKRRVYIQDIPKWILLCGLHSIGLEYEPVFCLADAVMQICHKILLYGSNAWTTE
jgi:hypothetical protein